MDEVIYVVDVIDLWRYIIGFILAGIILLSVGLYFMYDFISNLWYNHKRKKQLKYLQNKKV